jgi:two-component system nitrate/nitrite response regulator NarL
VVGDASDTRAALALTHRLNPDILLIECGLNRELATQRSFGSRISSFTADIVVIVETTRIQDVVEAFELGAKGVVLSASLPCIWGTGLQSILAGQYWVEDKSAALLLGAVRELLGQPEAKSLPEFGLTLREAEIAGQIAAGRSNKEVGREFSICERTVKHHLTNIFKKVGVSSRLELAVLMRDKTAPRPLITGKPEAQSVVGKPDQKYQNVDKTHLSLVTES